VDFQEMDAGKAEAGALDHLPIPLDRDVFLRSPVRTLEGIVGEQEANVFGHIAAENLGYAKVELLETIAKGHAACRVVVHLAPVAAAETTRGRVYIRSEASL
jgi:hypothetical protein